MVVYGDDQIAPDDRHALVNPEVVVEVLSPSTEASVSFGRRSATTARGEPLALPVPKAGQSVRASRVQSFAQPSDRGEEFRHYQRLASLEEYVLVSQGEPRVEVFQRQENAWLLRSYGPGEAFALPSRGITVSVDAVYADPRRA